MPGGGFQGSACLAVDELTGSPIEGDVKRKTLLPEPEARTVFAASSPRHDILLFFFSSPWRKQVLSNGGAYSEDTGDSAGI